MILIHVLSISNLSYLKLPQSRKTALIQPHAKGKWHKTECCLTYTVISAACAQSPSVWESEFSPEIAYETRQAIPHSSCPPDLSEAPWPHPSSKK